MYIRKTSLFLSTNFRNFSEIVVLYYSWIAVQLAFGPCWDVVITRSDLKSVTSFGILSPDYTGQSTCFL